jgi:hypothetical protein
VRTLAISATLADLRTSGQALDRDDHSDRPYIPVASERRLLVLAWPAVVLQLAVLSVIPNVVHRIVAAAAGNVAWRAVMQ